jgi:glutamyl-tRNA synthetase
VLALRRALGHDDQPVYAHLPLILGLGGGKLSKRHGAVSVEEYRDTGFLPAALLNYLALLGWGPEDGREILSLEELVAEFELERVNTSAATFDPKKLEWMNGEHIRAMPLPDLVSAVLPFARTRYGARLDIPRFEAAVRLAQLRATTLVQIADQMAFLFTPDDQLEIDPASWEKLTKVENAAAILDAVIEFVRDCDWTDEIDPRPAIEALGIKPGKVMHVLYTAIEGRSQGLPLFDSISLLRRESALTRLRAARARL